MAKDGLTIRIRTQKEMRNAKMKECGKDRKGIQERATARSFVTVYPAAGASRSLRSLLRCAPPRPALRVTRQRPAQRMSLTGNTPCEGGESARLESDFIRRTALGDNSLADVVPASIAPNRAGSYRFTACLRGSAPTRPCPAF